jgi:hypothetical protein
MWRAAATAASAEQGIGGLFSPKTFPMIPVLLKGLHFFRVRL